MISPVFAKLAIALWFVATSVRSFPNSEPVHICQREPAKYEYRLALAKLILEKTAAIYGEAHIDQNYGEAHIDQKKTIEDPSQERCISMLRSAAVDLAYFPPTKDRLEQFGYIPIDLHNGMLGYRVLLIHQDMAAKFSDVKTLEDLRQFTGGFGNQWGDFKIFKLNRLPVNGMAITSNLLAMLQQRRFDYFHRGLHEAWAEIEANKKRFPDLIVAPGLALHYELPVYFMFNKADDRLKARFQAGFKIIISDGSFKRLFVEHFGHLARQAALDRRIIIPIEYPGPKGLPPEGTRFWLPQ